MKSWWLAGMIAAMSTGVALAPVEADPALLERFHKLQHSGAAASFDPGTSLATVQTSQDRLALLHPAVVEGQ